jgi:hypothetical protein
MFWIPKPNKVPAATPAQGVVICDKNGTEKDNNSSYLAEILLLDSSRIEKKVS